MDCTSSWAGTILFQSLSIPPHGSAPTGASDDCGVIANTRALCVAQGQGISILLLQLSAGKMRRGETSLPLLALYPGKSAA